MTEIQIGFGAVVGDEHLAMLVRAHRARVDVEIGIQLEDRNAVAAALEQSPEAGRNDPLADAGDHPASHKDEFGHGSAAIPHSDMGVSDGPKPAAAP